MDDPQHLVIEAETSSGCGGVSQTSRTEGAVRSLNDELHQKNGALAVAPNAARKAAHTGVLTSSSSLVNKVRISFSYTCLYV